MLVSNSLRLVLALSAGFVLASASTFHGKRNSSSARVSLAHQDKQEVNYPMEQKDAVTEARRRLIMDDFVPLSCNDSLDQQPCPSWTSVVASETTTTFEQRVIIDCGTCVTMDQPELTLEQGLDIRGKLIFPESFATTLRTSSITVQGELEMHSTDPINGSPWIHIIMVGDESQFFTPIGENAEKCGGGDCEVDRKAITVAGGKVSVHGISQDTPTWLRLYDVAGGTFNNPTSIIVDSSAVLDQWLPGAELFVASHTRKWNDHQVRKIVAVSTTSTGHAQVELDSPIRRPTTLVESEDYAVEVGLLSRNILFEGGQLNPQDGGHFWIMHTPSVIQTIVGVHFLYFGIQGTIGRYPVHFHFCGNVSGSVVAKNTIQHSHQRCVVVHGTDNVLVEENIAFQTAGHCFMTEDGIETGNSFLRNLGAQIDAPATLITSNGPETDHEPAIFWLTNPTNFVEGNVAAGSSGSGFWYELKKRGELQDLFPNPISEPLGSFVNNVAHSNTERSGAVRLYPEGYLPNGSTEIVFSGLKSFRNVGKGIFIHKVHHFKLTGALFSDNDLSVDLDRAEAIEVTGTTIIGRSDSYSDLMARETDIGEICDAQGRAIGLDLHSWRLRNVEGGFDINNVDIFGFGDLDCRRPSAIHMDPFSLKQGAFETLTSFSNMFVEDGPYLVDFCWADTSADVESVYLIDMDGSLAPSSVSSSGPSALVSDNPKMTTFVDPARCTLIEEGCYQYCRETCFQSIRYEVDITNSENLELKVCQRGDPTRCIQMQWSRRDNPGNPYGDYPRIFLVHLPAGSYDAVFVDESGNEAWPTFVERHDELVLCSTSVDVAMIIPALVSGECSELVRNGNADASSTEPLFWLTANGGLELSQGDGVGNTNAFTGTKFDSAKLLQYIDTRCLTAGTEYSVTGKVKLLSENGDVSVCDPNNERCPFVVLFVEGTGDMEIGRNLSTDTDANGYQTVEEVFSVDQSMANSDRVYVSLLWDEQKSNSVKRRVFVDDFSVTRIGGDPTATPTTAPAESRFERPTAVPTRMPTREPSAPPTREPSAPPTAKPSGQPVEIPSSEPSTPDKNIPLTPLLSMSPSAVPSSSSPTISPKDTLIESPTQAPTPTKSRTTDEPAVAPPGSPTKPPTNTVPPASVSDTKTPTEQPFASPTEVPALPQPPTNTVPPASVSDTNTPTEQPSASPTEAPALPPVTFENDGNCENLIENSDMEQGVESYWESGGGFFPSLGTTSGFESPTALAYSAGLFAGLFGSDGLHYNAKENMDMSCLTPGSSWVLSAQVKLIDPWLGWLGWGGSCTPGSNCPEVEIVVNGGAGSQVFAFQTSDFARGWNSNGFNELRATFELPTSGWDGSVSAVSINIKSHVGFIFSNTLVVDSFTIQRVQTL